ncbi:glycosyltransferase [Photobacterium kasasachensis]|uniref:glycosyltransferase n=1 Tax=Photobacterium kasasachensis TaxID=2910240 RepID=UPI003D10DDB4
MNDFRPKVAVLIGCYNHERYIESCLESVIKQTYDNIVIYISDDCSKDNTVKVISEYIAKYCQRFDIILDAKKNNLGVANNYNSLIQLALKDNDVRYIIPFAGDDLMLEDKVARQVKELENNKDTYLCYSNMQWFNSDTDKKIINHFNMLFNPSTSIDKIIGEAIIPTPTLCIRREALENIKYNNQLKYVNDYLLTVELALLGGVLYIPEILVRYRKHGASIMDTTLFLEERVDAASYITEHYGYEPAAKHFASTAKFDYLIKSLNESNYRESVVRFVKLIPTFFSSQKWFFRLLKFLVLIAKRTFKK